MDPQENEKEFDNDEETLTHLIELKNEIERKIEVFREKINLKHSIQ